MAEPLSLPAVVVVTGTGTGVGKTVATAALTAMLLGRGADVRVAVVKPAQTGVGPDDPGDLDEVCRLVGPSDRVTYREFVRLRDPLAPAAAARREGVTLPPVATWVAPIADLAAAHDVVLVEGAGGLLVELDSRGGTLADLAVALRYKGIGTGAVIVASPGLGTLNHTALTAEALARRGIPLLGVIVGTWPQPPDEPDLAMHENLADLPKAAGAHLLGRLTDGAGALASADFRRAVATWLSVC
ncbi:MAG TPA: dethiobiotin synthase [Dermatophilaceae bacterium]|nr:dethiobiotin synthase [Dermatophilaceae bacterium]